MAALAYADAMDWDLTPQPDTTPIGDGRPDPVEAPAPNLAWVGDPIPAFVAVPPTVRRPDEDDDTAAQIDDDGIEPSEDAWDDPSAEDVDADAPSARPMWMVVVAAVLLVTFVGWAITSVISRI